MASSEDTRAMADILRNLQEKTEASIAEAKSMPAESDRVATITNPDTRAMANILEKLEKSTRKTAENLVEAGDRSTELKMAMNTSRSNAGVSVAGFEIVVEKQKIESITKNFYSVKQNTTGKILYSDLALFESAMSIVKRLMLNKLTNEIDRIVEMDKQYTSHLLETYDYKRKLSKQKLTESKVDVYKAKAGLANEKMRIAKQKILKTL
jgi:uncharacterized protein YukE